MTPAAPRIGVEHRIETAKVIGQVAVLWSTKASCPGTAADAKPSARTGNMLAKRLRIWLSG